MHISSLTVYPIKSCQGISLTHAVLDHRGIQHDRRWMVISKRDGFLTQRQVPKLALICPAITQSSLVLKAKDMPDLVLPINGVEPKLRVNVGIWNDRVDVLDQGEDVAAWLMAFLNIADVRLVRLCDDAMRFFEMNQTGQVGQVGLADSRPLLIIGEATLQDLNARLPKALPMNRFRPNVVIRGAPAYAEDVYSSLHIGESTLYGSTLCTRCAITTIDQDSGEKDGKEPLKTLATYRKTPDGVAFGRYFVHAGPGSLSLGDLVMADFLVR